MSQEQLQTELAKLREENAALTQQLSALTTERDRLIGALQALFPIPTEAELAEAEANPGQLTRFIDSLAAELGVVEDGR